MLNVKNHRNGSLGVPTATAVVIAAMVGSGVFTTLGFQVAEIRSTFAPKSLSDFFFASERSELSENRLTDQENR